MAMFCPNCGNEVNEGADICLKCGKSLKSTSVGNNNATPKKSNGMAIAGFVLSFFFALLGLIFSIVGIKKSKEIGSGKGLGIAGVIISSISLFTKIVIIALFGMAFFAAVNSSSDSSWDGKSILDWANEEYTNNYDYNY